MFETKNPFAAVNGFFFEHYFFKFKIELIYFFTDLMSKLKNLKL